MGCGFNAADSSCSYQVLVCFLEFAVCPWDHLQRLKIVLFVCLFLLYFFKISFISFPGKQIHAVPHVATLTAKPFHTCRISQLINCNSQGNERFTTLQYSVIPAFS